MAIAPKIEQIFDYLAEAIDDTDDNADKLLEIQFRHLSSIIQRSPSGLGIADMTASLRLLRSDRCPFRDAQAKALRTLISNAASPDDGPQAPSEVVRVCNKTQEFTFIHTYLCAIEWEHVRGPDATLDSVLDIVMSILSRIGCLHPNPQPTQKHIVAFIRVVLGTPCSTDEFYSTLCKLRQALKMYRKHPVPGAASGILKYTEIGSVFAATHPDAFPDGPPVACRIDERALRNMFMKGVCRVTHQGVVSQSAAAQRHLDVSTPNSANAEAMQFMQGCMTMFKRFANGVGGDNRRRSRDGSTSFEHCELRSPSPPPRMTRKRSLLALEGSGGDDDRDGDGEVTATPMHCSDRTHHRNECYGIIAVLQ